MSRPTSPASAAQYPQVRCWVHGLLIAVCIFGLHSPAAAQCALKTTSPSVTICTPSPGATVESPVTIIAGTTSVKPVTQMKIYVDNLSAFKVAASSLNTSLVMTPGKHFVVVQAWDSAGTVFKQGITITVASPPPPPGTGDLTKLRHIIVYVNENRSFDSYFGRLAQYRLDHGFTADIDGIPLAFRAKDKGGHLISPYHFQTVCHEGLTPSWNESHYDIHGGLMDRFMISALTSATMDPYGQRAMGYYDWTDLPYYYELATQFATSDRFFSSVLSATNTNRAYLIAGTSFGHIYPDAAPTGGWKNHTIFDRLNAAGISWRYYQQDSTMFLNRFAVYYSNTSKIKPLSQYYTDIQNESTLPSVIFIERAGATGLDEHPDHNVQKGAALTRKIIQALMHSPSWPSSVFIFAFDEGGGLFDHVPPPAALRPDNIAPLFRSTADQPGDFNQTGFRVPVIVVSPWVKPHFVSHEVRDLTSILKLIEVRFGLSPLTARDAAADDMTEFFDFTNAWWLTPPVLPDQPVTGICDKNRQRAPGF